MSESVVSFAYGFGFAKFPHLIPLYLENILGVISVLWNLLRLRDIPIYLRGMSVGCCGMVCPTDVFHIDSFYSMVQDSSCEFCLGVVCNARKRYQQ